MNRRRILNFLFLLFLFPYYLLAQDTTDYYQNGFIRNENYIYKPSIHTVTLERNNEQLSDAVIILNSAQQLHLQFDDLNTETTSYYYKFIHCDFNWQPSLLHESDYTDGFFYEQVPNYYPSFNTYQVFYHYSAVFPTEQMRLTKSGNYIVMVYDNNNPDHAVITWRFRVIETFASVTALIHRATIVEERNAKQEIDFSIDYTGYSVQNPYGDLKIVLQQNGRWDNTISDLKPLFMKDHQADYNYEEGNLFNGGNEYRNFDTRSFRFTTPYIEKITNDSSTGSYQVTLRKEEKRSSQRYSIIDDINGKFLIKIYDGRNDQTEADYAWVTFRLPFEDPLANGFFYVMGGLTGWTLNEAGKMKYDYINRIYTCSLFLKQGYYNYEYIWVDDTKKKGDETIIEGNHFETENDYSLFVYHIDPVSRYDRIIGFKKLSSKNIY